MERRFGVVEKRFEYKGHECLVVFTRLGFRDGYVSCDKNADYSNLDIDCHGGLTFGDELFDYYEPKKDFYLGFDCGHSFDGHDYTQAYEYGLLTEKELKDCLSLAYIKHPVRTEEYVENECKKIVDQLERVKLILRLSKESFDLINKMVKTRIYDFEHLMRVNEERLKNDVEYLSLKKLLSELENKEN